MAMLRRGRLVFLIAKELGQKYTKALLFGFISGLVLSLIFWRAYPFLYQQFLMPTERIAMVGEFRLTALPLSIQKSISGGLTILGPDGSALPGLAESWEATDSGKTYMFHLQSNARWHTGKPVAANDVNYNFQDVTLTAVDAKTLKATLKAPYGAFPVLASKPIFQSGLVGFGPYRVSRIRLKGDSVQSIKLIPVNGQSKAVEYRFYRTEKLAVLSYKLGEVDQIEDLSSPYQLTQWGKTAVEEKVNYQRIISVFFNLKTDSLKEKQFRQALAYGLPEFPFEKAYTPIPKTSWAYTDKVKRYAFNPDQTKKLLKAAKIASTSAALTITTFPQYIDVAQQIAASWQEQGIPADVKVENTLPVDYQVLVSHQDLPPDPDLYPFWHSTQESTNITHYANVKIDKLLEDGRQTVDMEKRKKYYADFQRFLAEDAPAVFLYYPKTYSVKRK